MAHAKVGRPPVVTEETVGHIRYALEEFGWSGVATAERFRVSEAFVSLIRARKIHVDIPPRAFDRGSVR
jgi:hypothetical protein